MDMDLSRRASLAGVSLSCVIIVIHWTKFEEGNKLFARSLHLNFLEEAPSCLNILQNLTKGKWKRRVSEETGIESAALEKKLDSHLINFRIKRGIHTQLSRADNKCGYANLQRKPKKNPWGREVGSWCNGASDRPCCSDAMYGLCGLNCNCTGCVDMRSIKHAEVSDWIPDDNSCTMHNYTGQTACEILGNFPHLHFVGDSFPRKMARGLLLTLREDQEQGALLGYDETFKEMCTGQNGMYWKDCKLGHGSVRNQLKDKRPFCSHYNFEMYYHALWSENHGDAFRELIKNLTKVPGSVVTLGVGLHMQCKVEKTTKYLHPSIQYLKKYYNTTTLEWNRNSPTWPHIVYMYPDLPGLLKPVVYHRQQGRKATNVFAEEMKKYCDQHGIAVLDFRGLTTGVHSYDGTHYGLGVNLMKAQMLLNYLDSLNNEIK